MVFRPMLLIRDTNLLRNILIKDFHHFSDRGVYHDERNDPLSGMVYSIEGDAWKNLRSKLTPAFTLGKYSLFFELVFVCVSVRKCIAISIKKKETSSSVHLN